MTHTSKPEQGGVDDAHDVTITDLNDHHDRLTCACGWVRNAGKRNRYGTSGDYARMHELGWMR